MKRAIRVLISGGGTGGHIFPAISIANAIKARCPEAEILFVGAENRMEMEKVPAAGYPIEGLPVSGFNRSNLLANFKVLWRLGKSLRLARGIVRKFNPDVAVGVGGYASGPTLWAAAHRGVPTLIQEQNSYAGVTNKLLASKARAICVAYEGMERFFPADKIVLTGNPVRQDLCDDRLTRDEACKFFGLDPHKKTILLIGGSLGALTLNTAVVESIPEIVKSGVQLVWQCGKRFDQRARAALDAAGNPPCIKQMPFIARMDLAYKAADLVISRAGASSISELCLLGKPVILVPSPNVAEDHQTKNAQALSSKGAAILVRDAEARQRLMPCALSVVHDEEQLQSMSRQIARLAQRDSAARIADIIFEIADKK
ncbi:undecaprenyldiphospho-muramoylpentapeptide beta-N-acetylglucosaminyltransferase [Barnesiella viscericola]|uniref:undecaprenyldiphospho-muramoylpentapeptide beta-N-acetylglucosaminyltransferase n=1 Tax=Barnesiella viscericola TaxID=397865 RepID=UPI00255B43C1|nr:undecaprenyldiphospho-muramoylpentapeptide beta-N-acetylglucosaminyltransferase [Barnesiella viscericola]